MYAVISSRLLKLKSTAGFMAIHGAEFPIKRRGSPSDTSPYFIVKPNSISYCKKICGMLVFRVDMEVVFELICVSSSISQIVTFS